MRSNNVTKNSDYNTNQYFTFVLNIFYKKNIPDLVPPGLPRLKCQIPPHVTAMIDTPHNQRVLCDLPTIQGSIV